MDFDPFSCGGGALPGNDVLPDIDALENLMAMDSNAGQPVQPMQQMVPSTLTSVVGATPVTSAMATSASTTLGASYSAAGLDHSPSPGPSMTPESLPFDLLSPDRAHTPVSPHLGSAGAPMSLEAVEQQLRGYKIPDLRKLCINYGLAKSGRKDDYILRLITHFRSTKTIPDLSSFGRKRAEALGPEDEKRIKREKNKIACQKSRAKKKEEASLQEMQILELKAKRRKLSSDVDEIQADVSFLAKVDSVPLDQLSPQEIKRLQRMIKQQF